MRVEICAVSDVGRNRSENEDVCFADGWISAGSDGKFFHKKETAGKTILLGVFDGMGGISAGEVAARIAADTALDHFTAVDTYESETAMLGAIIRDANSGVCDEMNKRGVRMGSTASMLSIRKNNFTVCNIGDSPIFLVREGKLKPVYCPHNERAEYEAKFGVCGGRRKFRLTQYIGIYESEKKIEFYVFSGKLRKGDRFLICSDGLTDMISEDEILLIMNETKNTEDAVRSLLDLAIENGGNDNISIIVADITKNIFSFLGRR